MMRKRGLNSDQRNSLRSNSSQKRDCDRVDRDRKANIFADEALSKPAHIDLQKLLPFLQERIAFKMPSNLEHLDGVLDYLNERLLKLGMVNPGDSEVLIALDEAIVNAIKHGNKCNPQKAVHIVAEISADGARFTVTDEGQGFARDQVPDPTDPARLLEPSGRGLLLINHIMDEVRYNSRGNQIRMFKRAPQNSRHTTRRNEARVKK